MVNLSNRAGSAHRWESKTVQRHCMPITVPIPVALDNRSEQEP